MNSPPYSQCDAKGRCLRHPTIQMSRKKKLGGWKKLLSLCPMCAVELMAKEEDERRDLAAGAAAICAGVGTAPSPPPRRSAHARGGGRTPPSRHRHPSDSASIHSSSSRSSGQRRQRRAPRVGHHDDDAVTRNDRTAQPARTDDRRSPRTTKRHSLSSHVSAHSSSDLSCDMTADLSYTSSEYSSGRTNGGPRPGMRRMASCGEMSAVSQGSQRSARSAGSRGSARSSGSPHGGHLAPQQQPRPYYYDAPSTPEPEDDRSGGDIYGSSVNPIREYQEEFVCGMELYVEDDTRCFYTGQVDVATLLPHGLGTLRTETDGIMLEGRWEHGRLIQESGAPPTSVQEHHHEVEAISPIEHPEEDYPQECEGDYADHQTREEYDARQNNNSDYCLPCTTEGPPSNPSQGCLLPSGDESSVAETYEDDDGCETQSCSSAGSFSAREGNRSSAIHQARASYDKLREFEKYIVTCDEDEDYYQDNNHGCNNGYAQPCVDDFPRPRRVRFQEDP